MSGPIAEITVDQLAERLAAGGVTVFDVREPDEHAEVHVPGVVLVPLGTVPDHVEDFKNAAGDVLVICKSGGRSMRACEFLAAQGVEATNVAGGTTAWVMSGRETAFGDT